MWTKSLPTKDGYYWFRKNQYKNENMVCVFYSHDESIEKENKERKEKNLELLSRYDSILKVSQHNIVYYARFVGQWLADKHTLETLQGEWQGPLTPNVT